MARGLRRAVQELAVRKHGCRHQEPPGGQRDPPLEGLTVHTAQTSRPHTHLTNQGMEVTDRDF